MIHAIMMKKLDPMWDRHLTLSFAWLESTKVLRMMGFPLGNISIEFCPICLVENSHVNFRVGWIQCKSRIVPFSGPHILEILSVGVPFLGLQHGKPAMIHMLQYQSRPIQQSIVKYLFGIGNILLVACPIQLLCPNQGHNLLGMGWKLCSHACVLVCSLVPTLNSC